MISWIVNTYYAFCWFVGLHDKDGQFNTHQDRDKFTFILRRQKERLGWRWWFLPLGTIYGLLTGTVILGMLHRFGYMAIPLFFLGIATLLLVHVLQVYKYPGSEFDDGTYAELKARKFHAL